MAIQKVKDSMRTTTGLDATKLTGTIAVGRLTNAPATDLSTLEYNQAILAFKIASANQLAKFSMVDQVIDEYQDATGIDDGPSNNYLAGGATTAKYYEGGSAATISSSPAWQSTGTDGTDTWYKYTTAGTYSFTTNTSETYDFLVVAGGGGGSAHTNDNGGGGGAGGYRNSYGGEVSGGGNTSGEVGITVNGSVTVTVGAGGAGGVQGGDSVFSSITSAGGGRGPIYNVAGNTGGSGSGGSGNKAGGASTPANQGYAGGNASAGDATGCGGGGGGAGAVGANSSQGSVSNGSGTGIGGAGLVSAIDGTTRPYAAGGGGGAYNNGYAIGGSAGGTKIGGDGGRSISSALAGTAGTANTGSGGGSHNGTGGSGVVIIRHPSAVGGSDLTLQSQGTAAESVPTTADLVILIEDAIAGAGGVAAINTDIKAKVSRDGTDFGDTYVTLEDQGDWAGTTKRIFVARNIPLTVSHDSGQTMKYKIETFNQSAGVKETRIHATSLAWA